LAALLVLLLILNPRFGRGRSRDSHGMETLPFRRKAHPMFFKPDRRLSLRDSVQAPDIQPSIWSLIAARYGAIPMVLAFVFVSIGTVGAALELIFLLIEYA
jgi:hypothetical protein